MSSRTKIIFAAIGVGVLLIAAYLLFFNNSTSSAVAVSGAPASAAEVSFLNLVAQVDPLSFDTSIFTDPRFMALVDIRTAVVPEPSGRTDPFAPLP